MAETDTHQAEWQREGYTMAFYVAICLAAALALVGDDARAPVGRVVWGTTVGLAIAHVFAFRLASRIIGDGKVTGHDLSLIGAQLLGASIVALLVSVPLLLLSPPTEIEVIRWILGAVVAAPAYLVARGTGASRLRSGAFAAGVVVLAAVVAGAKNLFAGH